MAKRAATNMEVKKENRNQIFRYLCKNDQVSNPDIAYALKLSVPTVTQNTKELMERGLVEMVGELQSTGGRRAKSLSIVKDARLAAGLDITGNHVGFLLANLAGEIQRYERVAISYQKGDAYFQQVSERLEQFLTECGVDKERFLGIGISFPGIVNLDEEEITNSHILGVRHLSFQTVRKAFPYPCYFLNDANAGAFAEGLQAGEDDRFFYLSLSNSVGGAVYSEKKLIYGKQFRCGEVGHMTLVPDGETCYCGKKGCLDAYCSALHLADYTNGKLELFFERLEQGDPEAERRWDRYTTYLAIAVNNIHMLLDCDIVLGGYVGNFTRPYIDDIWKKIYERNTFEESTKFIRSGFYKIETAAFGAAGNVIEQFIDEV